MRRRLAAVAALAAMSLALAGCGAEDEAPEEDAGSFENVDAAPETGGDAAGSDGTETGGAESDQAGEGAEPAGDLPTYEQAKDAWVETTSEGDRESCETGETEDMDVYTTNDGDFIRYLCNDIPRFSYVTGADNYADNFDAMTDFLMGTAVFHVPGEMIISPTGANDEMAYVIQEACGCGEVLGPEN
ncbi:hypothetical protein [Gulosibacter sp. 10]|uniref:hypothetical protein n=1 Tax=Gulosibacter sp. 10 TaxID=1255570 RepID=UPI00097E8F09|nr:hypothetical protein [Gulosibacter sp. 10]SJM61778.1 hypothetical protein FM112_08080 [Gulosibacter sp. 10]